MMSCTLRSRFGSCAALTAEATQDVAYRVPPNMWIMIHWPELWPICNVQSSRWRTALPHSVARAGVLASGAAGGGLCEGCGGRGAGSATPMGSLSSGSRYQTTSRWGTPWAPLKGGPEASLPALLEAGGQ